MSAESPSPAWKVAAWPFLAMVIGIGGGVLFGNDALFAFGWISGIVFALTLVIANAVVNRRRT